VGGRLVCGRCSCVLLGGPGWAIAACSRSVRGFALVGTTEIDDERDPGKIPRRIPAWRILDRKSTATVTPRWFTFRDPGSPRH